MPMRRLRRSKFNALFPLLQIFRLDDKSKCLDVFVKHPNVYDVWKSKTTSGRQVLDIAEMSESQMI
eukprot:TRINITY_DN307_c0_g2_i1.p1 TRINITY_DN307_c0_g2~~TRINITY_DN307_c0_g2_i1.p1  ORF type:complete len:66 (-),score=0.41 TRINITY_DN307_c0_g2_i1:192-389(-)